MDRLAVLALSLVLFSGTACGTQKTTRTPIGSIIGFQSASTLIGPENRTIVWTYLGIPYAQPPVGVRRFRKPVPMQSFQTSFKALHFGPACPQSSVMASMWLPGPANYSEDCLTLNIFSPEVTSMGGLPVMIWIHGGAYVIGQSGIYSGENLAAFGDVIVVTINYRLGPFGFLATNDDDTKGNYGLWDQRLAIQWVHNNIGSFGGNPADVTLFGESAGGSSAVYQAMFPGNRGLFKRIIAESGSANSAWAFQSRENAAKYTAALAKALGCGDDPSVSSSVECLRTKPYQAIIQHDRVGTTKETLFRTEYGPVVDNEIVLVHPLTAFNSENRMPPAVKSFFSEIDVITGINNGDGGFITSASLLPYLQNKDQSLSSKTPYDILDEIIFPLVLADRLGNTSAALNSVATFVYSNWKESVVHNRTYLHKLLDLSSDHFFFMPSLFTARAHAQIAKRASTYLYQFSHHASYAPSSDWIPVAQHGDEIPYVFGFPAGTLQNAMRYPDHVNQVEVTLSRTVMTYWTNFAKTG